MSEKRSTKFVNLPVDLSDDEKRLRGEALARGLKDLESARDAEKERAKKIRKKLEQDETDLLKLADVVKTGIEEREVECYYETDLRRRIRVLVRSDTKAIIEQDANMDGQMALIHSDDDLAPPAVAGALDETRGA